MRKSILICIWLLVLVGSAIAQGSIVKIETLQTVRFDGRPEIIKFFPGTSDSAIFVAPKAHRIGIVKVSDVWPDPFPVFRAICTSRLKSDNAGR